MEIESFEKKSKNTIFQILPDPLPELTASSEAEIVTLHTGGISFKSHFAFLENSTKIVFF